tara:strand:- start:883 stop:1515 length:633 start_codon:yes stop_codon:yes gene_type:complete
MKTTKISFVYRNIFVYRLILFFLYLGQYNRRYKTIINQIDLNTDKSVVELCFGDIFIAKWCQKKNISWIGFDINDAFIKYAELKKFVVHKKYIDEKTNFGQSDLIIVSGSLYHFKNNINIFLDNILRQTNKLIIQEPVFNWIRIKFLGNFIKTFTNVNGKEYDLRFTFDELKKIFNSLNEKNYKVQYLKPNWKDAMIVVKKVNLQKISKK